MEVFCQKASDLAYHALLIDIIPQMRTWINSLLKILNVPGSWFILILVGFVPFVFNPCMKRANIHQQLPLYYSSVFANRIAYNKRLNYQQTTSTYTATSTPSLTISPSPTLTATVTMTSTLTASPSPSSTSDSTFPSTTPTATPAISVQPSVTSAFFPPTTDPAEIPSSIMLTETAQVSPSVTETREIETGETTATATLIPYPTINLRTSTITPSSELFTLNQEQEMENLEKGSQPLIIKLTRFWPLVLLFGIWSLLAGWFLLSHWLTRD